MPSESYVAGKIVRAVMKTLERELEEAYPLPAHSDDYDSLIRSVLLVELEEKLRGIVEEAARRSSIRPFFVK